MKKMFQSNDGQLFEKSIPVFVTDCGKVFHDEYYALHFEKFGTQLNDYPETLVISGERFKFPYYSEEDNVVIYEMVSTTLCVTFSVEENATFIFKSFFNVDDLTGFVLFSDSKLTTNLNGKTLEEINNIKYVSESDKTITLMDVISRLRNN